MTTDKQKVVRRHFRKVDPIIHKAMKNVDFDRWIKPRRLKTSDESEYVRALCREIIGQQLSGKSATAIIKRFNALFDDNTIVPEKLLRMRDKTLRNVGMSWSKARYIKNIARTYVNNTVQFSKLHKLPDEEITSQLTAIKGVGNWTVEMFLIFTLRREDVFSHGDLGLKKGFMKLYKIEKPSTEQIEKVTSKWKPFRTYGSITLWHALDSEVVEANKKIRE
jgi:DNA-3-methyladenine glycosylase II